MNIDKKALKKIVDEIEASRLRQRAETEHQREVMKRAKDHQLDAKAIRIVLQRRSMGDHKRDEQDYYVHAYELALGGKKAAVEALERGATVREAAVAGGISTGAAGNLAKSVQKSEKLDKPDTDAAPHAPRTVACPSQTDPEDGEGTGTNTLPAEGLSTGEEVNKTGLSNLPDEPASTTLSSPKAPDASGTVSAPATEEDDLAFPPFLKRQPQKDRAQSAAVPFPSAKAMDIGRPAR